MNAAVVAAAAGDVEARSWAVQPSLAVFLLVVALLVGFYLGRASDGIHAAWLRAWATIGKWATYALCATGAVALLYLWLVWWSKHKGGG